ncbi:hypothetical protein PITC_074560 [Penicillium italicum]|uniref:Uncharacterized protein n=1 Tax=Penicillium italicum TaxID=40296 RepID=A0A0A2LMQ6_PENIT|nr:hypothetical protein PITC_074560 [Penicillium italicum]
MALQLPFRRSALCSQLLCTCCWKLSLLVFIRNLTPASWDRQFTLVLRIFIVLWTIAGT